MSSVYAQVAVFGGISGSFCEHGVETPLVIVVVAVAPSESSPNSMGALGEQGGGPSETRMSSSVGVEPSGE